MTPPKLFVEVSALGYPDDVWLEGFAPASAIPYRPAKLTAEEIKVAVGAMQILFGDRVLDVEKSSAVHIVALALGLELP